MQLYSFYQPKFQMLLSSQTQHLILHGLLTLFYKKDSTYAIIQTHQSSFDLIGVFE